MKKYIGLTLFLIGAILLVYMILLPKIKPNIKNTNLTQNTGNSIVVQKVEKNSVETGNDEVVKEVLNLSNTGSVNSGNSEEEFKIVNNTIDTGDIINTGENVKVKNKELVIGNMTLYYASGDKTYDDIFDILGVSNLDKYKINGKKIYIKKIDSIDYETEKVNMERLIHKIGGNIANVNWFGDKQLFVNLDPYYKKESISLVEYKGDVYFMVLPYDKYYEYKKVIKEFLFAK